MFKCDKWFIWIFSYCYTFTSICFHCNMIFTSKVYLIFSKIQIKRKSFHFHSYDLNYWFQLRLLEKDQKDCSIWLTWRNHPHNDSSKIKRNYETHQKERWVNSYMEKKKWRIRVRNGKNVLRWRFSLMACFWCSIVSCFFFSSFFAFKFICICVCTYFIVSLDLIRLVLKMISPC